VSELTPNYDIKVYQGEEIKPEHSLLYSMQGDATLGMGDTIWLISYLRDVFNIKGRRRCKLCVATSKSIARFNANFLPKNVEYLDEYMTLEKFESFDHVLPAMYYWKERDEADRSWLDNKSILERLYGLVGIEYNSLPDWGEFTPDHIMYPQNEFYQRLGIDKNDKYVFFQWHSSGNAKNLPTHTNIKLLKHITEHYGYKCYIIGRLDSLDKLNSIPGVVNLSRKTTAEDVFSIAFNSEFIVSPDSAGIHLGEAYRIPSVGIMATLPPIYIAAKYKIPTFMFGSGFCPFKPCGIVHALPLNKCPKGTEHNCVVLQDVDLALFDKCVAQSYENRRKLRLAETTNFYNSQNIPITLG
jgi:hypothetical protein